MIPPEDYSADLPGVIGSLVSLLFLSDTLGRRFLMFIAGCAFAYFGSAWASKTSGLDPKFAGFLLGLFGMVAVSKTFQTWNDLELTFILRDWLRKLLGLPAKEERYDVDD